MTARRRTAYAGMATRMLTTNALELDATSVEMVDSFPLRDWVDVMRILIPRASSCPWWIGDLMVYGQTALGVTEEQLALVSSGTLSTESGPTLDVARGELIPSEDDAGCDLVEPTRGELLIESRGKRAILLTSGRILLTSS